MQTDLRPSHAAAADKAKSDQADGRQSKEQGESDGIIANKNAMETAMTFQLD